MPWLLAVIAVIAAEVVALVEVAKVIGGPEALLLLIVISASGPWLVRRAGVGVWRRTRERVAAGQSPGPEALDGVALLAGGVLVCIPGFLTDIVGLALLLPPVRALAGRYLLRHFTRRMPEGGPGGTGGSGAVINVGSHPSDGGRPSGGGPSPQPGERPLEPPR